MSHTHRSPNQDESTPRRNLAGPLRKSRAAKHARLRPRPLRCEPLEDRRLLSVYANTTALAIPDVGKVTSQINVPDAFIVGDLNVKLTIEHPRDPDLHAYLIAPDNTRVELFTDVGTTKSKNFTNTVLDDAAMKSITLGTAPFTGTFRPEGNLTAVEGKQVQGNWKLEITDDTKRRTGTLKSWSIEVEPAVVPDGNFIDTNPTMLGNAGMTARNDGLYTSRKIVVSDNGDAMAVWLESKGPGDTGPWNAMAARYVAGSWQTPEVIMEVDPSFSGLGLELAGDGQGNYLAVMQEQGLSNRLWARRYVAESGWQRTEPLDGVGATPRASMAQDAQGVTRAVIAWGGGNSRDVKISRLDNFKTGIWSGEEIAEDLPSDPGIAYYSIDVSMAQNGDFMLVFHEEAATNSPDPRDAYYRVYRQETGWEGPETLMENGPAPVSGTQVVMNSSGVAMVSWHQQTGTNNTSQLWARRWNGTGWDSDGEVVSDRPENGVRNDPASLAINEQGKAVVLYVQWDGTAYYNAFVRSHDGAHWATVNGNPDIIQLDTEDLGSVGAGPKIDNLCRFKVAMDDAGNAAAVWTQDDGFYVNMWASQFDGATWSTAEKLENAALDAVLPSVDMSAGVAQVIWTQSDGSLNHMYSATLPLPGSGSPLLAVPSWISSSGTGTQLIQQDASQAAAAAMSMWAQRMNLAEVPRVNVLIADLPAGQLGWASGHTITLDTNANGAGWFVDATPWEHSEFVGLNASASGRVDLLTVMTHEIGHVLGFEHSLDAQDVMAATLPVGTRRLPGLGQLETVPSTLGSLSSPISVTTSHTALTKREPPVRTLPPSAADKTDLYLLKPLAMQIVEQSTSRPESIAARILRDVLDERADALDENLLDLLAHAAV